MSANSQKGVNEMKQSIILIFALLFTFFIKWVGDGEISNSSIFVVVVILGLNNLTKEQS